MWRLLRDVDPCGVSSGAGVSWAEDHNVEIKISGPLRFSCDISIFGYSHTENGDGNYLPTGILSGTWFLKLMDSRCPTGWKSVVLACYYSTDNGLWRPQLVGTQEKERMWENTDEFWIDPRFTDRSFRYLWLLIGCVINGMAIRHGSLGHCASEKQLFYCFVCLLLVVSIIASSQLPF